MKNYDKEYIEEFVEQRCNAIMIKNSEEFASELTKLIENNSEVSEGVIITRGLSLCMETAKEMIKQTLTDLLAEEKKL